MLPRRIFALLLTVGLLLSGCMLDSASSSNGNGSLVPLSALQIKAGLGCDDYRSYLARALSRQYLDQRLIPYPLIDITPVAPETATAMDSFSMMSATSVPDSVTQTNTQEAGVDEGDIVKVDSNGLIYTLGFGQLSIARGFPPLDMKLLSVLYQKNFNADELYIDEPSKTVILIGYGDVQRVLGAALMPQRLSGAVIQFIDVSDPKYPVIRHEYRLDGYRVASRKVGQTVHLVTRFRIETPPILTGDATFNSLLTEYYSLGNDTQDAARKTDLATQIEQMITAAVTSVDIGELLPWLYHQVGTSDAYSELFQCQDVFLPEVTLNPGLLAISSFSADGATQSSVGVMNNAWLTYATQDSLYVAQTSGGWWWWTDRQQRDQTVVYKFAISGSTPVYRAFGSVAGTVGDRYQFSEWNGYLRLVTTERWYDQDSQRMRSENTLRVLAENTTTRSMTVVGETEPFADDESIFAVRMLGDRGYVVTYRVVDPLFTFDLSDPRRPYKVGELEIPGFSTYMHPLDDGYLLTIGRGSNIGQIQLQVFDVTDLANPQRLFQYNVTLSQNGYDWSPALYDPHAFTYFAAGHLLAIPLSYYDSARGDYISTITSFRIDPAQGITELGSVRHDDLAYAAVCPQFGDTTAPIYQSLCVDGYNYWYSAPRRAVYMTSGNESFLYTMSNVGIKVSPAATPEAVINSVVLPIAHFE